jgi:5'-nucleotidase
MNASPSRRQTIGISTRALFEMDEEEEVLRTHGREAYRRRQLEKVDEALPAGPGLAVVRTLLQGSSEAGHGVEVVIFSDSVADASLRILSSARQHDLDVERAVFTGGEAPAPYLRAFRVDLFLSTDEDLFLSTDEDEASCAMEAGTAAALVCAGSEPPSSPESPIRIVVEGAAVARALEDAAPEPDLAATDNVEPLPGVGVPRWVRALAGLQRTGDAGQRLVRTALLSGEDGATRARIPRALSDWEVELDQAFLVDDPARRDVLAAFGPHLVFDLLHRRGGESHADLSLAEREASAKRLFAETRASGSSFSRLRLRS